MLDAEEPNLVLKLIRSRFLFFFFFYSTLFLLLLLGQKLCPVAGVLRFFQRSVGTSTANSTQFAFFGRLLVKKFFVKKVLRGAKKLGSGARFLVFLLLEELGRTFSQRTSLTTTSQKRQIGWNLL